MVGWGRVAWGVDEVGWSVGEMRWHEVGWGCGDGVRWSGAWGPDGAWATGPKAGAGLGEMLCVLFCGQAPIGVDMCWGL